MEKQVKFYSYQELYDFVKQGHEAKYKNRRKVVMVDGVMWLEQYEGASDCVEPRDGGFDNLTKYQNEGYFEQFFGIKYFIGYEKETENLHEFFAFFDFDCPNFLVKYYAEEDKGDEIAKAFDEHHYDGDDGDSDEGMKKIVESVMTEVGVKYELVPCRKVMNW